MPSKDDIVDRAVPWQRLQQAARKPGIIIADDHRLVAAGFEQLLAPDYEILLTVHDNDTLLRETGRLLPNAVLLDMAMPPHSGVDVIRALRQAHPILGIVIVTMNNDPDVAAEAFRAGASAYVLKNGLPQELLDAVSHVMDRQPYVTPLVAGGIVDSLMHRPPREGDFLTMRQREVLRLLAEGKSMKEVASILNVAVRTVAFHKYRMMRQLNIKTSAELVRFAVARHIV
jgi:DNA-binding NarL/FixJ family response regulator